MSKMLYLLSCLLLLPLPASALSVKEPTEVYSLEVEQKGYSAALSRFNELQPSKQADWNQLSGTWYLSELWPDPSHLGADSLGSNPDEIVVKAKPHLSVALRFYSISSGDNANFGKFSTNLAETNAKWFCYSGNNECGWISQDAKTVNAYRSCRIARKESELLCSYVTSQEHPNVGGGSLGKVVEIFRLRKPGVPLRHLSVKLKK